MRMAITKVRKSPSNNTQSVPFFAKVLLLHDVLCAKIRSMNL